MNLDQVAYKLGCPLDEIQELTETPAGTVVAMTDSSSYIFVPDDAPDAAGKTGLMYHEAPHPGYSGTFPVFQADADSAEEIPAESAGDTPAGGEDDATSAGDQGAGEPPAAGDAPAVPVRGKPGKAS